VTPRELAVDQLPDSVVTRTLTLSNSGGAELNYTVLEIPPHLTPSVVPASASDTPTGEVAVSPAVLQALEEEGRADFWVRFAGRADLRPAYGMGWQERGRFVVKALQEVAGASQAEARAYLEGAGADHAPHWIVNAILVRGGDASLLRRLRAMAGVESIHETRNLPVPEPVEARPFSSFHLNLAPEWGLAMIRAPEAWALARGEGVVVANVDTGVRYTHEALVNQYRGNSNGEFDHDFNWYDPQGEVAPVDDNGHGTHTMGTMVGDDGAENQVGVAPGARWIAADGCDATDCPDVDLVGSAEWILAPCPVGVLPGDVRCDVDRRPHVVNNSWGDCELATTEFFEEAIDAWRAAGIFTVFSNGNTGNCEYSSAFCGSLGNPARHYQVTSVGATDENDDVAAFSLWGPSDDPDPRLAEYADVKPEVSAPGHYVRSAYRRTDSDYVMMKGTSMAAPHVSGIAALVLSAGPAFTGEHDALEDLLKETAVARPYTTTCGNEGPGQVPNNAFGWGRVDALAAVERAVVLSDVPWLEVGAPTGTVPIDGSVGLPVTLDARGLPEGLYTATLRVQHDDPYAALIDVQVAMRVWSDQLYLPLIHR
jgi:subtilisin family serine protease